MKRLLLFFACLISAGYAYAADSTVVKGTQERILEELIEIRAVQDSTYIQRMKAFEARNSSEALPSEYSVLSLIKGNTDKDSLRDGWNVYGWIAFCLSLISIIIAIITFKAQRDTEKHTKNAPISVQRGKLADLPRHFYRNLVCTGAIIFKYLHPSNGKSANRKSYPSESNLLKLQTLPDDVFLPVDIDENSYKVIHELKVLFRNYNMEVMVASDHLSKQQLTDDSLVQDFDNLLFKPFFLTRRTFEYQKILCPNTFSQNVDAVNAIINEHFTKLMNSDNFAILLIPENNAFLKQMLDSDCAYIKNTLDVKGSIVRSIKDEKCLDNSFAEVNIIKTDFIRSRKNSALQKFIDGISSDKDEFIKWLNANYEIKDKRARLTYDDLYESMKPYLDYVTSEKWNFETLFYYILAIDIAIETDRIGMINY